MKKKLTIETLVGKVFPYEHSWDEKLLLTIRETDLFTVRNNRKYLYYTCHRHARSQAALSECPIGHLAAGMVEDMVFRNVRAALALPEIVASVSRLTNLTPADVSRELGDGVWKGLGNGVKQRLLASIVKEAVVHADRIEITLNTAGFAPLMQEVWNAATKD